MLILFSLTGCPKDFMSFGGYHAMEASGDSVTTVQETRFYTWVRKILEKGACPCNILALRFMDKGSRDYSPWSEKSDTTDD